MAKVAYLKVKEAVKALNESGLLESPIKVVAVKKETVIKAFMDAVVASANEDGTVNAKLPDVCFDTYNDMVDAVEAEKKEEKGKGKGKTKEQEKETAAEKKKAAAAKKKEAAEKKKAEAAKKKLKFYEDPEDPRFPFIQKLLKKGVPIDEIVAREFIGEALLKDPKLGVPELQEMLLKAKIKANEITVMDAWSKCLYLMNF